MDKKVKIEFDNQLLKPDFRKIDLKVAHILKDVEENTELYKQLQELQEIIDEESGKMEELRQVLYMICNKM